MVAKERGDVVTRLELGQEDGCEVAPHCTECPLAVCQFEVRGGIEELRRRQRDAWIRREAARGVAARLLALRFGLSARSVWRILGEAPAVTRAVTPCALPAPVKVRR